MKSNYIIYFLLIVTIIVFAILYVIDIPIPSTTINEKYNLNPK